jgi:hypothetical protein
MNPRQNGAIEMRPPSLDSLTSYCAMGLHRGGTCRVLGQIAVIYVGPRLGDYLAGHFEVRERGKVPFFFFLKRLARASNVTSI